MTQRVGSTGLLIILTVPVLFPTGLELTEFANDADPLDFGEIQIGASAMNINGLKASWSTPAVVPMSISLTPGTEDDINMSLLFDTNRIGINKIITGADITAVVYYPDGISRRCTGGSVASYTPARSSTESGFFKSRTYSFEFESVI